MTIKKKELSKTEWKIMNICWALGKCSVRNIYDALQKKDKNRSYQALNTMLERLAAKNVLKREKFGPIWLYEPAGKKQSMVNNAIDDFIEVVLDQRLMPLFTYFSKTEKIGREEIYYLKKIIKEHDE